LMAACEGGHFFVTFPSNGGVDDEVGRGGEILLLLKAD
jgi:hypothetical protein